MTTEGGSRVGRDPYLVATELSLVENHTICVVEPGPREVFVDIDTAADLAVYEIRLQLLQGRLEAIETRRTVSRHGNGWHVVVTVPFDLSPMARIALQAGLGSDPTRELLSAAEVLHGSAWPMSVFFEIEAPSGN